MTRGAFFLFFLLLLVAACFQRSENTSDPNSSSHILKPGRYVPAKGKLVNMDSVAKPTYILGKGKYVKASKPNYIPEKSNYYPVRVPQTVPAVARAIEMDTLAQPKYISTKGKRVPSSWPKWIAAQAAYAVNTRFHFSYLNKEQGLNSDWITVFLESREGKIWMGTRGGGLSIWDGKGFTHYTAINGLSHNEVMCLLEDREGNIWIGTMGGGLSVWDGAKFTHYSVKEGLSHNVVRSLLEDRNGNIWIGTQEGGLSMWNGKGFTNYTVKRTVRSGRQESGYREVCCLSNYTITSLLEDREGQIWIGTIGGGVNVWDGNQFTYYTQAEGLGSNAVASLLKDTNGNIWIGTSNGVNVWDGARFTRYTTKEGLHHNEVVALSEDQEGKIWVGSPSKGLSIWDGNGFSHISTGEGLSNNSITSLLTDRNGKTWIGTQEGANLWDRPGFTRYIESQGLNHNDIWSLLQDRSGNIWIGSSGGGLSVWDGKGFTHYTEADGLKGNWFHGLLEDQEGNIWIGTVGDGVSVWDGKGFTQYTTAEGLIHDYVFNLLEDREGNIWIATYKGVSRWDGSGFTNYTTKQGLSSSDVNSLLEDRNGNIWMGTWGGGVSVWDPDALTGQGGFSHFTEAEGLSDDFVGRCLMEDREGNIWIGSPNRGVSVWDGEGFTYYTTEEGLSHNNVWSLFENKSGEIWIGTEKGLNRLRKFDGTGEFELQKYLNPDGLGGLTIRKILVDQQERLWLGGKAGIDVMDLRVHQSDTSRPNLVLRDLQLFYEFIDWRQMQDSLKKGVDPTIGEQNLQISKVNFDSVQAFTNLPDKPVFPHNFNQLTLAWNGIHLSAPHKLQYSYFLEGKDQRWSPPINESKITYHDLRPNDYIFKVKAVGGNGQWSKTVAYAFRVRPPWWLSWWAYLIFLSLAFGLIYLVYNFQINKQLAEAESRRLKELDQVKSRLYTNITHEFRTPLTIILGVAKQVKVQVQEKVADQLEMIQRNGQMLLQLINQMLDLSKLEVGKLELNYVHQDLIYFLRYLSESFHSAAESRAVQLHFLSDIDELVMDYDPKYLQQIFFNLLSNALKFTPEGGNIYIQVSRANDEKVEVKVKDTGKGVKAEDLDRIFDRFYQVDASNTRKGEGTGIGLALIKELVKLMEGDIQVKSKEGMGTEFILLLPIRHIAKDSPKGTGTVQAMLPGQKDLQLNTLSQAREAPKVLIIEDNRDVRQYIGHCLGASFHLEFALDGQKGIQKALDLIPDVVISDVMMPLKDGFEVCEQLKKDRRTSHIPIILLTARADRQSKLAGLQYGADVYLTKPFDEEELLVQLNNLLLKQERLKKHYLLSATLTHDSGERQLPPAESSFVKEVKAVIQKHLGDSNFTVNQLSKEMALSPSQLHRKLTALTGFSASKVIRWVRLNEAKKQLHDPSLSISEVAYACGFNDPDYFSKVFKTEFGMIPTAFRKQENKA